jgi:RNA polymerase sigma-70 factor (ECF subfamily)
VSDPRAADRDLAAAIAAEVPALLRTARAHTRNPHYAGTSCSTVARGLARGGPFRGESSVRHWLRRIMHRLAVDRWRRDREISVAEVEESWMDEDYSVDAEAVVERAETRAEIEDALVRLPYDYRTTVVLHDLEGLPAAEIAEVGLPAAKQRLRRGRMMLVTALAEGLNDEWRSTASRCAAGTRGARSRTTSTAR